MNVEQLLKEIENHRPWIEAPEIWPTEAKYFSWLRGEMRRMWTHYPPRNKLKMSLRKRVPKLDDNGNVVYGKSGKNKGKPILRYELPCSMCGGSFPQAQVEMDHIKGAGKCNNGLEACVFLFRLLCPVEDMRAVCKPCHKTHTYAERWGLTFEEAATKKKIIELTKIKVDKQKKQLLSFGYTDFEVRNKAVREEAYTELVAKGKL